LVKIRVNYKKCSGEALCVDLCPVNVFEVKIISEKRRTVPVREENCIACKICEVNCPSRAIIVEEL